MSDALELLGQVIAERERSLFRQWERLGSSGGTQIPADNITNTDRPNINYAPSIASYVPKEPARYVVKRHIDMDVSSVMEFGERELAMFFASERNKKDSHAFYWVERKQDDRAAD